MPRSRARLSLCLAVLLLTTLFPLRAGGQLDRFRLSETERANVRRAVDNLRNLIRSGRDMRRPDATALLDDLDRVLANINTKLENGQFRSIPGLDDEPPKKYRLGGRESSPRAAFCVRGTQVFDGTNWVDCPEGDIILDKSILDPNNDTPIDPTGARPANPGGGAPPPYWGWSAKWTLLHILVHEKWHEAVIQRAVADAQQQAGYRNKQQQLNEILERIRRLRAAGRDADADRLQREQADPKQAELDRQLEEARRRAASVERHGEVYEAQKNVLRLLLQTLEREENARPRPARERLDRIREWKEWLRAEIDYLERRKRDAMRDDHEFAFDGCSLPPALRDGTVAIYATAPWGYARTDVDMARGRPLDFRVPQALFLGVLYQEAPIGKPPTASVTLSEKLLTTLSVQPERCRILDDALRSGALRVFTDPARLQRALPQPERVEDLVPAQQTAQPPAGEQEGMLVGIVLPADRQEGEQVSGRVVPDPGAFADNPALQVVTARVAVPRAGDGKPDLDKLHVRLGDGEPQPAGEPFTFRVPAESDFPVHLAGDRPGGGVTAQVPRTRVPEIPATPGDFRMPPVCSPGIPQVVHGPFDGASGNTRLLVGGRPAVILAETPRALYWALPSGVPAGRHEVVLQEAGRTATFQPVVVRVQLSADRLTLQRGESTQFRVTLSGPEALPESAWRPGAPAETMPRHASGIAGEGQPGAIVLTLENLTPAIVTMPGAAGTSMKLTLGPDAFAGGPYTHSGSLHSINAGQFSLRAIAVPFLAWMPGDEETPKTQEKPAQPEEKKPEEKKPDDKDGKKKDEKKGALTGEMTREEEVAAVWWAAFGQDWQDLIRQLFGDDPRVQAWIDAWDKAIEKARAAEKTRKAAEEAEKKAKALEEKAQLEELRAKNAAEEAKDRKNLADKAKTEKTRQAAEEAEKKKQEAEKKAKEAREQADKAKKEADEARRKHREASKEARKAKSEADKARDANDKGVQDKLKEMEKEAEKKAREAAEPPKSGPGSAPKR